MLTVETHGRIRVITLARAEARNAVNPALAQTLYAAMRAFDADAAVDVAVLTGSDGNFCAGYDLKSASQANGTDWITSLHIPEAWVDPIHDPIPGPMGPSRLMLSKPVIAAIEGFAVAGGMELALWSDIRIIAEDAQFGVFCRRWGVPLIDGGTVRLPKIVGQGRANDLILTGRPVLADEALSIGLADRVTSKGGALAAALALAETLTQFPQGCMRADFLSARGDPADLAAALKREWASAGMALAEGVSGATRFVQGSGRGGRFDGL